VITSTRHPLVRALRRLHQRRGRAEAGQFLVDGVRLVEEALAAARVERVLLAGDAGERARAAAETAAARGIPVTLVAPHVLAAVSGVETPPGILAVVRLPPPPPAEVLDRPDLLLVVADRLQDPGNTGTLIRVADAAGAHAVALLRGGADPYHPKVVRGTMGSLFHLPVLQADGPALVEALRRRGVRVVVLDPEGPVAFREADYRRPLALVVGNEGAGVDPLWRAQAAQVVRVPIYGRAESLNAAVAAALVLYEAAARAPVPAREAPPGR